MNHSFTRLPSVLLIDVQWVVSMCGKESASTECVSDGGADIPCNCDPDTCAPFDSDRKDDKSTHRSGNGDSESNLSAGSDADTVADVDTEPGTDTDTDRHTAMDGDPANPAYMLINLAIGGSWAGRHGIDDDLFPTAVEVDYVRVYAGNP